jgi:hypothetical protein
LVLIGSILGNIGAASAKSLEILELALCGVLRPYMVTVVSFALTWDRYRQHNFGWGNA